MDTRLYLNGKLVQTAPGSEPGGDTPFVIGNVGENNLIDFFRGEIRSVRISEGERYSGDRFDPLSNLVGEESTLLLVSEPRLDGDAVLIRNGTVVGRVEQVGK